MTLRITNTQINGLINAVNDDQAVAFRQIKNLGGGDLSGLFFDPPKAPTDGSYNIISGTRIDLSWNSPSTTLASFDFPPSSNNLNYLPYMDKIKVGYRIGPGTTGYTDDPDITIPTNLTTPPNIYNLLELTLNPTGSTGNTIISGSKLTKQFGGVADPNGYRFRIAYTNRHPDVSYIYIPSLDNSNVVLTFGKPGPANAPASIVLDSTDYDNFTLHGFGSASGLDASLNIAYGTAGGIYVGYGADISGSRVNNLQVAGLDTSYNLPDISFGWPASNYFQGPRWPVAPTNVDLSTFAHPEYKFENIINTYYARNSSTDFSNIKVYNATATDDAYVRIPSRTTTTTTYHEFLDSKNLNFAISGTGFTPVVQTGYRRGTSTLESNVYFLADASLVTFTDPTTYQLAANFGDSASNPPTAWINPSDSILGLDTSGEEITRFILDIDVGTSTSGTFVGDISSVWKVGYTGQPTDTNEDISDNNLRFTTGQLLDPGAGDIRTKGYFLGVDVSNLVAKDISLGVIPDICNNSYNPYKIQFKQQIKDNTNTIEATYTKEHEFKLAKLPPLDVSVISQNISVSNPALGTNLFYGVKLPGTATFPEFTIDLSLNELNHDWAPHPLTKADGLYTIDLKIDPDNKSGYGTETIDTKQGAWPNNRDISLNVTETLIASHIHGVDDDFDQVLYSRDMSAGEQFLLEATITNNLHRIPTTIPKVTYKNDLSFNGKALWWDFTWGHNIPIDLIDAKTQGYVVIPSEVNSYELCEIQNPFTSTSAPPSTYLMTTPITYNQAMWAKDAWFGDNNGGIFSSNKYPYINYTNTGDFYDGPGPDYSVYDGSGDSQSISYSSNSWYTGTANSISYTNIKWICIKLIYGNGENYDLGVTINDSSTTLTLGTDYSLFYMEEHVPNTSTTIYPWYNGGSSTSKYYSPWMDCANKNINFTGLYTFTEGQSVTANSGFGNGIYKTSSTYPIQKIKSSSSSTSKNKYLLIGIPRAKKITKITITNG